MTPAISNGRSRSRRLSFRRAVLRGLGVVMPPLMTIVILVWVLRTVQLHVLNPVERAARDLVAWAIDDTRMEVPSQAVAVGTTPITERFAVGGQEYVRVEGGRWIPAPIHARVQQQPGRVLPQSSEDFYDRYVELTYLRRPVVLPVFALLFVLLLYLLGRFLAYRIGRGIVHFMEYLIGRLPIVRVVYTSVKQVTDFLFRDSETEFTRVVAVEYPRRGVWSLGFVTGDGMRQVAEWAGEPMLSVLMPTSPMPATGVTIMVPRSAARDMDLTIDQAVQFIMSCGVVVPMTQQYRQVSGVRSDLGSPAEAD